MELTIERQEVYSRGELLLRAFFGFFYIMLPHGLLLLFVSLWGAILSFISFWIILFTGRYPESFFEFQVGLMNWNLRVNASILNLVDGYPAFGVGGSHPAVKLEVPYPENLSRGTALLKLLFGWFYVGLPHGIALGFMSIAASILQFIAFWAVLFTGEYPQSMHSFMVGFLRWNMRVSLYLGYMTDKYPPFSLD